MRTNFGRVLRALRGVTGPGPGWRFDTDGAHVLHLPNSPAAAMAAYDLSGAEVPFLAWGTRLAHPPVGGVVVSDGPTLRHAVPGSATGTLLDLPEEAVLDDLQAIDDHLEVRVGSDLHAVPLDGGPFALRRDDGGSTTHAGRGCGADPLEIAPPPPPPPTPEQRWKRRRGVLIAKGTASAFFTLVGLTLSTVPWIAHAACNPEGDCEPLGAIYATVVGALVLMAATIPLAVWSVRFAPTSQPATGGRADRRGCGSNSERRRLPPRDRANNLESRRACVGLWDGVPGESAPAHRRPRLT